MGDVIKQNWPTRLDVPPEKILAAAAAKTFDEVVVIGFEEDGSYFFASSKADAAPVIFLTELTKKRLLEICDPPDA